MSAIEQLELGKYYDNLYEADSRYNVYGAKFKEHPSEDLVPLRIYKYDMYYFDMASKEKKIVPHIKYSAKDQTLVQTLYYGEKDDCEGCICNKRNCRCRGCKDHHELNKYNYFDGREEKYRLAKVETSSCVHGNIKLLVITYPFTMSDEDECYYDILVNKSVIGWLETAREYYQSDDLTEYRGFDYVEVATLQYEGVECTRCNKSREVHPVCPESATLMYNMKSSIPYHHRRGGKPEVHIAHEEKDTRFYVCILCGGGKHVAIGKAKHL